MKTFLEYCSNAKSEKFGWLTEALGFPQRPMMGAGMGGGLLQQMKQKFGGRPYMVDDHLIELMAKSSNGSMTRRQAMDAISSRHGHQIASWMNKFMETGGKFDPESERTAPDPHSDELWR